MTINNMQIIDSHCHLNILKKKQSLNAVLENARQNNVTGMLNISVDLETFSEVYQQTELQNNIWASVGIHPCHCQQEPNQQIEQFILEKSKLAKVIAIGESGLDFFHSKKEQSQHQYPYFELQIALAKKTNLPIIIHCRNAKAEVIDVLKTNHAEKCGGVMHCFAEDWQTAKAALDLGFYISFSGILTYKKSEELRDIAKKIPLNKLLVETDSPYLSPEPVRNQYNQPANVLHTLECLANTLSIKIEEMAEITSQNFKDCFKVEF